MAMAGSLDDRGDALSGRALYRRLAVVGSSIERCRLLGSLGSPICCSRDTRGDGHGWGGVDIGT